MLKNGLEHRDTKAQSFILIEYPQTSHVGAYGIRPEDIHVD